MRTTVTFNLLYFKRSGWRLLFVGVFCFVLFSHVSIVAETVQTSLLTSCVFWDKSISPPSSWCFPVQNKGLEWSGFSHSAHKWLHIRSDGQRRVRLRTSEVALICSENSSGFRITLFASQEGSSWRISNRWLISQRLKF